MVRKLHKQKTVILTYLKEISLCFDSFFDAILDVRAVFLAVAGVIKTSELYKASAKSSSSVCAKLQTNQYINYIHSFGFPQFNEH